ncbi:serine hydrolase [Paenibacillus sp. L3-i20]|uniref:serine hydrolase domain-containing protein n=1 Tax=Paenibacillus sp. L3-i20 TaxID=2905833 RepID=UPI001EDD57EE|nr:serine hydrolase domain-containing protein [Paenibacillus sp. L3-i20]GKU78766.1 penicillin-binding protein [Paenibacillus sp. L3-i20]
MKKKVNLIMIVALALAMFTPVGATAAKDERLAVSVAEQKAKLLIEKYGTTSIQYALIDNGKIELSGQAGAHRVSSAAPVTAESMYSIGSTSKVFTAVAVMKLVEQGKVELDKPVTNYITDFKMKDERYKQITPRMLVNHSAGFSGSTFPNGFLFDDDDTAAHDNLLTHLSTQRLKADPGAFSVYSNDGFTLAEILVERVSGMDFTSFLHKHITEPLNMKNTKTQQDDIKDEQLAGVYAPHYKGELPRDSANVIGAGGIVSTAEDLVSFSQIFTGHANGLLTNSSVSAMSNAEYRNGIWPKEADSIIGYGLGWDSVDAFPFKDYGIKALVKGGDTLLSHAILIVLPEHKMSMAVVSSRGSSSLNQLFATEVLLTALQEKGIIKERKPTKSFGLPIKAVMPKELTKYSGIYAAMHHLNKIVVKEDGQLVASSVTVPQIPAATYTYTADGSFVSADGNEKVRIVTEKNGHTYLSSDLYQHIPDLGQVALSQYSAQKLEDHKLTDEVAAAWAKRQGKMYFTVSEKYTSQVYFIVPPVMGVTISPDAPGYWLGGKITGTNEALNVVQIPGVNGRDTLDSSFRTENNVEYLTASGSVYVSQDGVKQLFVGPKAKVTIQENGYARWFKIPDSATGKTLSVKKPEESAFVVYDQSFVPINHSYISGSNEVKIPAGATIVFIGEDGAQFDLTWKK